MIGVFEQRLGLAAELGAFVLLAGERLDHAGAGERLLEDGGEAGETFLDLHPQRPQAEGHDGGAPGDDRQEGPGDEGELPVGDRHEDQDGDEDEEDVAGAQYTHVDEPADGLHVLGGAGH